MRSTKATATARLTVVSNPETAAPDRVLRLTVCVPATQENGDAVLKVILNGFEDTINLIGEDFSLYSCETGDTIKTGQTVRVGNQPPGCQTGCHSTAEPVKLTLKGRW